MEKVKGHAEVTCSGALIECPKAGDYYNNSKSHPLVNMKLCLTVSISISILNQIYFLVSCISSSQPYLGVLCLLVKRFLYSSIFTAFSLF